MPLLKLLMVSYGSERRLACIDLTASNSPDSSRREMNSSQALQSENCALPVMEACGLFSDPDV